jgi:hypothetical protein
MLDTLLMAFDKIVAYLTRTDRKAINKALKAVGNNPRKVKIPRS